MSQGFERAKSRLDNIKTIEPLLSALRTMSLGAWQMANRKITHSSEYEHYLDQILTEILPEISPKLPRVDNLPEIPTNQVETIILIVGSERGLCGKFNTVLVEKALKFIDQNNLKNYQVWVMGARLLLECERRGVPIAWRRSLPASGLSSYQEAYTLTQDWLEQFESYAFNQFLILHNQIARGGTHQFTNTKLLPYEIDFNVTNEPVISNRWPPPIKETDPEGMFRQIIQHFLASTFFQVLLKSAAAEHSTRYHLMQEASENAEEIIEDLIRVLNAERKRKITQEMQEIAVSAGLIQN